MNLRDILVGSLIALTSCTSPYNHQENNNNHVKQYKDIISMERIEELMKRGSVDEILKEEYENKTIEHLVYNPKAPEESAKKYKEFVFQEHLDSKDRKPVLVMIHSKPYTDSVNMREAIILKEIERIYGDKINSSVFDFDQENKITGAPYGKPSEDLLGTWIVGSPSIAMYGQFDLLKGETPEKNDGKIKHLDTLFKGPKENKETLTVISNCIDFWINPNIFHILPPNNKLYRHKNDYTLQVISMNKR